MNFKSIFFRKIIPVFSFVLIFMFFSSFFVLAQDNGASPGTTTTNKIEVLNNPIKSNTIQDFVRNVLQNIVKLGIPLIALAIIYSGFLFVSAVGNPGKIEEAKTAFINALIGAALLLGAWGIAEIVVETVKAL
ncbi:MAG: hypothetical protein KBD14_00860 [Candidatus Pacebacteria bacterium]|nr:hypothetical protein [Candidatus Paceibacterota bacterium]